ncbi:hypothetical protein K3152_14005 [Qipengyuania sp. 1NDH17]|uniref:Uncharacterized protein n=1 Tax=Qipengyuania polymorpha TaxID=2867234 RepID=A0ABS7J0K9_9SPHN|nr:DUF6626 family protein [Qipengyuania polymorpha]MBX7459363.1 hypothetical protein [Qipengyuania polymorpha]
MSNLDTIFHEVQSLGLCRTQEDFSVDFLGKSPGYMAYLRSSNAPVCLTSIKLLFERLKSHCPSSDDSRWHDERARMRSLIIAVQVMWNGECELRHLPPWHRATAI